MPVEHAAASPCQTSLWVAFLVAGALARLPLGHRVPGGAACSQSPPTSHTPPLLLCHSLPNELGQDWDMTKKLNVWTDKRQQTANFCWRPARPRLSQTSRFQSSRRHTVAFDACITFLVLHSCCSGALRGRTLALILLNSRARCTSTRWGTRFTPAYSASRHLRFLPTTTLWRHYTAHTPALLNTRATGPLGVEQRHCNALTFTHHIALPNRLPPLHSRTDSTSAAARATRIMLRGVCATSWAGGDNQA